MKRKLWFFLITFFIFFLTLSKPSDISAQQIHIYPNDATGQTCNSICSWYGLTCNNIGTDVGGTSGDYTSTGGFWCAKHPAGCSTVMGNQGYVCYGRNTMWTNCRCTGTLAPTPTPTQVPTPTSTPIPTPTQACPGGDVVCLPTATSLCRQFQNRCTGGYVPPSSPNDCSQWDYNTSACNGASICCVLPPLIPTPTPTGPGGSNPMCGRTCVWMSDCQNATDGCVICMDIGSGYRECISSSQIPTSTPVPTPTSPPAPTSPPSGGGGGGGSTSVNLNTLVPIATPNLGSNPTLGSIISSLLGYLFPLLSFILIIFIVISGYQWMTSGNQPQKLQAAQRNITWAIVGFIIMFIAYWIVQIVGRVLGLQAIINIFG
jgi:hypothetical protein